MTILSNKAILGKEACYFASEKEVTLVLEKLPEPEVVDAWRQINLEKVRKQYTWDEIVEGYQKLFVENISKPARTPVSI